MDMELIRQTDPEIAGTIDDECQRQSLTLELIASENIARRAVMVTQGSVLTNKYAEGYPAKRYYGGVRLRGCGRRFTGAGRGYGQ